MTSSTTPADAAPRPGRPGHDRDWGRWALLFLLAVAGHLVWVVTPNIQIDLHPLPWILAVYVGYRMGRWAGFAAGGLSVLTWTACALWRGTPWSEIVLDGVLTPSDDLPNLYVRAFSLQAAGVACALGFLGGWLRDLCERRLGAAGSTLAAFLPEKPRTGTLPRLFAAAGKWLTAAPEGGPSFGGLVRKLRGLGLPALMVLMNLRLQMHEAPLRVTLPPDLLAAVAVLVAAFFLGGGVGIALALLLWLGSWALWLAYAPDLTPDVEGLRLDLSSSQVPQIVGLCILAWWAARLGAVLGDESRRAALRSLWPVPRRPPRGDLAPTVALSGLLLVFALGCAGDVGPLRVAYGPHYVWFLVLALYAARRDPAAVSSRAWWPLLVLALVGLDQRHAPDLGERSGFALYTMAPDAVQVVLLAALPLLAGRLDLTRRAACRFLAYGFLGAWTLGAIYLRGGLGPDAFVLDLSWVAARQSEYGGAERFVEYPLVVLSWLLQLALFELAARLLQRAAGEAPAA